ncbi:hypothetical protein BLOT_007301 [Blomia tropicalis]|nr:hypothetical protein BLOT_007301 [Blomia tropicalis]
MDRSKSIAIIGGGISGLSTAFYLLKNAVKHGKPIRKVFILETQSRFGGWLQTSSNPNDENDFFELGPRTISTNSYGGVNAIALVHDIGLAERVRYISKGAANFNKRFVAIDGKLFQLPSKFYDLFPYRQPFKPFISYLVKDFLMPPMKIETNEDVSVDRFFRYRFGNDVADYLVNPLCIGITGGDSKALSMKSMFPNVLRKEQTHGSVVKGMFTKEDIHRDLIDHPLVRKSIDQKWAVFSLEHGIETLTKQLCSYLEKNYPNIIELLPNSELVELSFDTDKTIDLTYLSNANDEKNTHLQVDHVFSSIPAFKLANVLKEKYDLLRTSLLSIDTVHMGVVSLEYDQNLLSDKFNGFGFLVPSSEKSSILGVTFDSCIFPNGKPGTKLTVMLGGYRFLELFGQPDSVSKSELLKESIKAIRNYLHIQRPPTQNMVTIHQNCIPQYTLGHEQRIATIETEIAHLPLSIVGSSYHGFSVPECILNARIQVNKWLNKLD